MTRQFFSRGETIAGTAYCYLKDHLGSVHELTDSTGIIQAKYRYDNFGRTTRIQGSVDSDFQFAGMYIHIRSGLYLTPARQYNNNLGIWLSRDMKEEGAGSNLYAYVSNSPVGFSDPTGLDSVEFSVYPIGVAPALLTGNAAYALLAHAGLLVNSCKKWYTVNGAWVDTSNGTFLDVQVSNAFSSRSAALQALKTAHMFTWGDPISTSSVDAKAILDSAARVRTELGVAKIPYSMIPYGEYATSNQALRQVLDKSGIRWNASTALPFIFPWL